MDIMTIVIGAGAGYLLPMLRPRLVSFAESVLMEEVTLTPAQLDQVALVLVIMLGGVVCAVIGVSASAIWLGLGVLLGMFGKQIWARIEAYRAAKRNGR